MLKRHQKDITFIGFSLLCLLGGACVAIAETAPSRKSTGIEQPKSIMWIGNSFFYYNNSMHAHYFRLLRAGDPKYEIRQSSVTISGSGFGWQDVDSLFRPNAIGSYHSSATMKSASIS
jgi:hypothetical protein